MAYVICDRILKDSVRAKEAVMAVFENLLVYLKKYEIDNFRSWLISVLRNQCYLTLRQKSNNVNFSEFCEKNSEEFMEFNEVFTLSDKEVQEQKFRQLDMAMSNLPREQAECVELFYMKGKTYDQISEITGYTFNQIKSHIQNGKRNLKNIILKNETLLLAFLFYFINVNI